MPITQTTRNGSIVRANALMARELSALLRIDTARFSPLESLGITVSAAVSSPAPVNSCGAEI